MYAIKLMPPEVSTLRMGKGQSQRIHVTVQKLAKTHKNFEFTGEKILSVRDNVKKLLDCYIRLRQTFEKDNE